MSFFSRFRRAVNATIEAFGATQYQVKGEIVTCPVCGGREFVRSSGGAYMKPVLHGLNAPWMKLDRFATSLICEHCAHILTFGRAPELADDRGMGRSP